MRSSLPWIKEWVQLMLDGKPIPPIRRASLGVNFSQEAELPLLKGGAKKVVVCTSANRELGSMEVTDGDAFISVYLPPDVQDKVSENKNGFMIAGLDICTEWCIITAYIYIHMKVVELGV